MYQVAVSVKEQGLKEFALPGSGDGDSGRWYTDDELADIIGDDWFQDFDVSHDEFNIDAYGEKAKQNLAGYANSWFDDKGYNVNVMGVDHNEVDHDLKWYIVGSFQNDNFADKDLEEVDRRGFLKGMGAANVKEGWKTNTAIGAGLGALAGSLSGYSPIDTQAGAAAGAMFGGALTKKYDDWKKNKQAANQEKEKENQAAHDDFVEKYNKLSNYFYKISDHYNHKFQVRSTVKRPGDVRMGKEWYENYRKRNHLNEISQSYYDLIQKEVYLKPDQYANRIEMMKKIVEAYKTTLENLDIESAISKGPEMPAESVNQGVAEGKSPVIANTADRLSNKDDGRTAKLRAAGDARREQHLKGRDIAKNDRSSKDAWGDLKESYQGQFKSKEEAVKYAKERVKTLRDKEDGIEVWAMPNGSFDVNHTMNSNGRNHIVDNGGKKLGTIRP